LDDQADKSRKNLRLTLHTDNNGKHVWIEVKVYERGDLYIHLATDDPAKRAILVALFNTMDKNCGLGGVLDIRQPKRSGWTRIGYLVHRYKNIDRIFEKICECLKRLNKYYQMLNLK
jgi:hypothetical protein